MTTCHRHILVFFKYILLPGLEKDLHCSEGGVFPFYPGLWTPCSQNPCQKQEQLNAN